MGAGLGGGGAVGAAAGGGGHGGAGGYGYHWSGAFAPGGDVNDSATNPILMGSAGGAGNGSAGGSGGGAIRIDVAGTLQVDGRLTARGGDGYGGYLDNGAGGGVRAPS